MNNEELNLGVKVPLNKCASTVKIERNIDIEFSGYEEGGVQRLLAYDVQPDAPSCMITANGIYVKGHVNIQAFGTNTQSDGQVTAWSASDNPEYEAMVKCDNYEDAENVTCHAVTTVVSADVRPSDENTLTATVTLSVTVKVVENRVLNVITDINEDEDVRVKNKNAMFRTFEGEFQDSETVEEKLVLPQSKPAVSRILYSGSRIKNYSIRQNPGYYDVSGEAGVLIAYLADEMSGGAGGLLQTGDFTIPFNFVVATEGVPENSECFAEIMTENLKVSAVEDEDGEMREVDITLDVEVSLECYSTVEAEIPDDVFGVGKRLELVDTVSVGNPSIVRQNGSVACVKAVEMDGEDEAPGTVLMSSGRVRDVSLLLKDGIMMLAGSAEANVIYALKADDDNAYRSIKVEIPFQQEIDGYTPDGRTEYSYSAEIDNCRSIVTMGNVMETKFDVKYIVTATENSEISVPTGIREVPRGSENAAAGNEGAGGAYGYDEMPGDEIVMYVVGENDDVWSIAKRFLVSPENVLTADGEPLESEPAVGSKVFIV